MNQISHFLLPGAALKGEIPGRCCVCGWDGLCLPKAKIMSGATGSVSTLCPLPTNEICIYCASLWKEPKVYSRSIWATKHGIQFPTIAPDPASDRPTWRKVIRSCDPLEQRVAILTTDPKKRVWCYAQISQGHNLSLYLHDPSRGISSNRILSLKVLLSHLEWIEDKMTTYGFSKAAIADSLIRDIKAFKAVGVEDCMALEATAQSMRLTPEFIPALIIAQKEISE